MKKTTFILAVFLLLLPATFAMAEKQHGWPTLTLTSGGYSLGNRSPVDDGFMYGIKLGYEINGRGFADRLGIEGVYQRMESESQISNADADVALARLDLLYLFNAPKSVKWLEPFLTIGAGALMINDEDSDSNPVLGYGFGSKFKLTDYLKLRAELRQLLVFDDDKRTDYEYTLGLSYYFGVPRKVQAKEDRTDSDNDGVFDSKDKCPATPVGLKVNKKGCPVDAPDNDADGVPNYQDKCPGTSDGLNVDESGCFLDDDGDGVPNELDRCPSNPPGFQVDEYGCTKLIRRSQSSSKE